MICSSIVTRDSITQTNFINEKAPRYFTQGLLGEGGAEHQKGYSASYQRHVGIAKLKVTDDYPLLFIPSP